MYEDLFLFTNGSGTIAVLEDDPVRIQEVCPDKLQTQLMLAVRIIDGLHSQEPDFWERWEAVRILSGDLYEALKGKDHDRKVY